MNQIYFEAKGEELLEKIGMTKTEFAKQMGIRKQNVKALFKSKNLETIHKAADVMGVPFEFLIGYVEEPDIDAFPMEFPEENLISEEDIPTGDTTEDKRNRYDLIYSFYSDWKRRNPEQKKYNISLKEDINIRAVSLDETAAQASLTYLSTLAVLQLDAILTYAKKVGAVPVKPNENQKPFEKMIVMNYDCPGIGTVKMTVGVRRGNHEKVQYCITAIEG